MSAVTHENAADLTPLPINAAIIEEFVAQADVVDATRRKYRTHLLEFERWHQTMAGNEADMTKVRPGDISRFMAYLQSGSRYAGSRHSRTSSTPMAATRKNFFASLGSFYRYLVRVEIVTADPTRTLSAPKVPHKPGLHLTAADVLKLLAVQGHSRERVQVFLLTFTGARVRELRTLRWRDVDWTDQTMQLLGKGAKYRVIDIHPRLMGELRRWQLAQTDIALSNADVRDALANPDNAYVLLTSRGRMLSPSTIIKQLKRRAATAGLYLQRTADGENLSAVHPHALRRTFGTILLNDGHHLDAVADVLGHASVDTTRKHYAFASTERRKATIYGFKLE